MGALLLVVSSVVIFFCVSKVIEKLLAPKLFRALGRGPIGWKYFSTQERVIHWRQLRRLPPRAKDAGFTPPKVHDGEFFLRIGSDLILLLALLFSSLPLLLLLIWLISGPLGMEISFD